MSTPMKIECPQCGRRLVLPEGWSGRAGCPRCQHRFEVLVVQQEPAPTPAPTPAPPAPPPPAPIPVLEPVPAPAPRTPPPAPPPANPFDFDGEPAAVPSPRQEPGPRTPRRRREDREPLPWYAVTWRVFPLLGITLLVLAGLAWLESPSAEERQKLKAEADRLIDEVREIGSAAPRTNNEYLIMAALIRPKLERVLAIQRRLREDTTSIEGALQNLENIETAGRLRLLLP